MLAISSALVALSFSIHYESCYSFHTSYRLHTNLYARKKQSRVSVPNVDLRSMLRTYCEIPSISNIVINILHSTKWRLLQSSNYFASIGVRNLSQQWNNSLFNGHIPGTVTPWPSEALNSATTKLKMNQLTRRHAELVMILLFVLELAADYGMCVDGRILQEFDKSSVELTNQYKDNSILLYENLNSMSTSNFSVTAVQHKIAAIAFTFENKVVGLEIPCVAADKLSLLPLLKSLDFLESTAECESVHFLQLMDGEFQNPPMHPSILHSWSKYEIHREFEIRGLAIAKRDSAPLEMICTNFEDQNPLKKLLGTYDMPTMLQKHHLDYVRMQFSSNNCLCEDIRPASKILDTAVCMQSKSRKFATIDYTKHVKARRSYRNSRLYMSNRNFLQLDIPTDEFAALAATALEELMFCVMRDEESLTIRAEEENENLRTVILNSLNILADGLVERDVEVKLLLLSVLCREHVVLLGPPGTGKSELGRRLARICSVNSVSHAEPIYFERLLTKYTNPEELFGPLSLSALERDEYVRNLQGYLPSATVAFLDEIFKANSAILNSLLTILNERKFDNGNVRISIPLLAVVAASNELPESEELDALYDRFLFRRSVEPVSDSAVKQLLMSVSSFGQAPEALPTGLISDSFACNILRRAASVTLTPDVLELLSDVRAFLRDDCDPSIYCSDRRLVKAAHMLRVVAATHNRNQVTTLDCLLLSHVLWYSPEDRAVVYDWLWSRVVPEPGCDGFEFLTNSLSKRMVQFVEQSSIDDSRGKDNDAQEIINESQTLANIISRKIVTFKLLVTECEADHLWLGNTEKILVKQQLASKATQAVSQLNSLFLALLQSKLFFERFLNLTSLAISLRHDDSAHFKLVLESFWSQHKSILSGVSGDAASYSGGEIDYNLSAKDVALSKREAQKQLSPANYKLWKKAQKGLKKRPREDDDGNED